MKYTGANIFSHSSTFKAVDYNMEKIDKGVADLLIVRNFNALRCFATPSAADYKSYLLAITRSNSDIRQRQLHASIGVEEKSVSTKEIANTAQQWLWAMGYEKQPYLIFGHYDAQHAHVHMVSSRVTSTGKLINNSMEKLRAREVLDKILGIDIDQKIKEDSKDALSYRFKNIKHLSILLKAKGYFVAEKEGYLHIYYQRTSRHRIPVKLALQLARDYTVDRRLLSLIQELFKTTKHNANPALYQRNHFFVGRQASKFNSWHSQMVDVLEEQLDIKIVFENQDDQLPHNYMIIDRKNKHIYDGEDLMPLAEFIKDQPYRCRVQRREASDSNHTPSEPNHQRLQQIKGTITSPRSPAEDWNLGR